MEGKVIIGGIAFDKTDPRLTLIHRAAGGKGRYYRKSSKHIVKVDFSDIEYAHKDDVIVIEPTGQKAPKWHRSVTRIPVAWKDGEEPRLSYVRTSHVLQYNGDAYHVQDSRLMLVGGDLVSKDEGHICTHPLHSGYKCLKINAVQTAFGTIPSWAAIPYGVYNPIKKQIEILYADEEDISGEAGRRIFQNGSVLVAQNLFLVFMKDPEAHDLFREWVRMDAVQAMLSYADGVLKMVEWNGNMFLVLASAVNEDLMKEMGAAIASACKDAVSATDRIKRAMSFDESKVHENLACVIDDDPKRKTLPGGNIAYDFRIPAAVSPTSVMVGGMQYTFGLEFECSAGYLPVPDIMRLFAAEIGDRSIRANEYVTPPLHGDVGVRLLMDYCKTLQKHSLVDDKCGLHIHVGGAPLSGKTSPPAFNRAFSVMAVKLGILLEHDMFMTQPPSRSPMSKHTASIVRNTGAGASGDFTHISPDNWRSVLGKYVFGKDFSKDSNSKKELGKWHEQRYKWLNLCHCNSSSRFKTIEFRIFSGKFDPLNVLNELRIALAFVWFVENRAREILYAGTGQKKIDLEYVVSSAYKHPYIKHEVLSYIRERMRMYHRKIY